MPPALTARCRSDSDSDCASSSDDGDDDLRCFGPTNGCGGSFDTCTSDAECTGGDVCNRIVGGRLRCASPCTDDDGCASTDRCGADGHCQQCSGDARVAKACSADTDCSGGSCVESPCSGQLGVCREICE